MHGCAARVTQIASCTAARCMEHRVHEAWARGTCSTDCILHGRAVHGAQEHIAQVRGTLLTTQLAARVLDSFAWHA
eukprot:359429-Chlamydomonas_euryale.AAC.5